jgi:NDP-sugar pyrophosphorylase family protein
MKAVILVGGLGTRLRPYTFVVPKPLLPLGDKAILQHIIERFRDSGIREIILATGYHSELMHAFCGDGSKFGVEITYVHEEKPLGTAGPLSLIRSKIKPDERLILMNGDIVTQLEFRRLLDFSVEKDHDLTVCYAEHTEQSPFGVLAIQAGIVEDIEEKPARRYSISAGIYVLKGSTLAFVPDQTSFTMPDLVKKLIACKKLVGAYRINEFWMGLDKLHHFDEAIKELNKSHIAEDADYSR